MRPVVPSFAFLLAGILGAAAGDSAGPGSTAKLVRPKNGNGSVRLIAGATPPESRLYKRTPQGELRMHLFFPPGWKRSDRRPAIVFFFGGGWRGGSAAQFIPQAEYFASRGLVCAAADYRIANLHGTTPDICVEDAKTAVRWLRAQAKNLGLDPGQVIAAGGSAGAQLAAATASVPGFNSPDDDLNFSCVPTALVLFNPALNMARRDTRNAAGEPVGEKLTPTSFLRPEAPPAILFYGTNDALLVDGEEYLVRSRKIGSRCELWLAGGERHGFFNREPWTTETAVLADRFLASLGYLKGPPTLASADRMKPAASRLVPALHQSVSESSFE